MKKSPKRKTWRETLASIQWTEEIVSVTAFAALAAFALWPLIVLAHALTHGSFDLMVDFNRSVLDGALFPVVTVLSVIACLLALIRAMEQRRSLLRTFRSNPTFAFFLALVAWMIIDIPFTNGVTDYLRYGAGLKHESFFLHLEYFLCFLPLGLLLSNPRLKLWLLRGMTVISVILSLFVFYLRDNLQASPQYYDWRPVYATIFTNTNYYGYFLTVFIGLSALFLAEEKSRLWSCFYAASLILNTTALSYNNTLGAWIGSLCACLFVVAACRIRDGRFRLRALAPLALFVVVMLAAGTVNGHLASQLGGFIKDVEVIVTEPSSAQASQAGSKRWGIWKNCLKLIVENPVFGIGFEGVHVRVLEYVGNPRPHNEFMQYALFYGIPGGLLYILGCAGVYREAFRRRAYLDTPTLAALTAAFGYLAGSFFGLTVYNTAPYLFIMMGLGYVWGEANDRPRTGTPKKNKRLK